MINPMTLKEQHQALDDVDAGRYMEYRTIGTRQWISREFDHGKPLNFAEEEYRHKPEPRELFVNEYPSGAHFYHTTLASAKANEQKDICGTAHYIEDTGWVEPMPAELHDVVTIHYSHE